MENMIEILSAARQLKAIGEHIESLVHSAHDATHDISNVVPAIYENMLIDEIEHAQIITLELTRLLSLGDENNDVSGDNVIATEDKADSRNPAGKD